MMQMPRLMMFVIIIIILIIMVIAGCRKADTIELHDRSGFLRRQW